MKTIIFAGGGTLGHVMPALSVINVLKSSYNIIFITDKKCQKAIPNDVQIKIINVSGLTRKASFKNITAILKYMIAKEEMKKLIRKLKPDLVIGMGGYVSAPVIRAAIKCNIKTIIHEQNAVIGLVNKYFQSKVDKLLLSFPMDNGELVGNPRITDYYERHLKSKNDDKTIDILFVGGSGGAKIINDFVITNQNEFEKNGYKVKLITGKKYYKEALSQIKSKNIEVIDFADDLFAEFKKTKILVSRSGATTIAEALGSKTLTIFIPSKNVVGNHQFMNAVFYKNMGVCELVEEENLNQELLFKIQELLQNKPKRIKMLSEISNISCLDAKYIFANQIIKLIGDCDGDSENN